MFFSPLALEKLGNWLAAGAEKYGERNWEKGIGLGRHLQSLYRHLMKYMQGATDEDHLAALITNGIFVLHFEETVKRGLLPASLNDLPLYSSIPRVHQNKDEPLDY